MSRGCGEQQRLILLALDHEDTPRPLYDALPPDGDTRSARASLLRAANKLDKAGLCVVVHLWNDEHTTLVPCVARPDAAHDGRPIKELSVKRISVAQGGKGRFVYQGSLRHLAMENRISVTTVRRDLKLAGV